MERAHYRSHQSLDYGHSWPQYTAEPEMMEHSTRVMSFRGPASSSWPSASAGGRGRGSHDPRPPPRSSQWRPALKAMNFTTTAAPPTPAQIDMLNWFGSSGGSADKYAYFLDRGNGRVTRLIPADMLPPLNEIPAWQIKGYGMEVLPALGVPPPSGVPDMNQRATIQVCGPWGEA